MRDKIVFWATDKHNAEVLAIVQLRAADNKIDIWTVPKLAVSKALEEKIAQNWELIEVADLPENTAHLERSLDQVSLLPDDLRTTNTDLVNRAEREWYVKVLSLKLEAQLENEIAQLDQQVQQLVQYDPELWTVTQSYWDKINKYYQERDLSRESAAKLRDRINACFNHLKALRKAEAEQTDQAGRQKADEFIAKIEAIYQQISPTANLTQLFNQLKNLQNNTQQQQLPQKVLRKVHHTFNRAFEAIRAERNNSQYQQITARINGLENALQRLNKSLKFDEEDLAYHQNRQNDANGQLEMQLRQAKIRLIEGNVQEKRAKIADMQKLLRELQQQLPPTLLDSTTAEKNNKPDELNKE